MGRLTPAALPPFPKEAPLNRLGLARWLTDPGHPLTARVAVNRYWQMFFGRGIVASAENFGLQGAVPSHPELLDWLARDFIASGWNVKALCKKIVLSSTYRQRSAATPKLARTGPRQPAACQRSQPTPVRRDAARRCPGDGWLARAQARRPTGQALSAPRSVERTECLSAGIRAGQGRRTVPPQPVHLLAPHLAAAEHAGLRRARPRSLRGSPSIDQHPACSPWCFSTIRNSSRRRADWANAWHAKAAPCWTSRLTLAFRLAATRHPTEAELQLLKGLYQRQLDLFRNEPAAAQKYLRVGERPLAQDLDPGELAAAAVMGSVILNLDASLMIR